MKKTAKVLVISIGALILLLVIASLVVTLTFDPNDHKDDIAAWVKARTGRDLVIGDDLELSVFPWLGVETGNVSLANAPEFGDEPFATLEKLDVRARLWPLLHRQFEVGTVVLDGLRLNLARNARGDTNWADLMAALSAPDAEATPQTEQALPPSSLAVAGLRLRGAMISWHENVADLRYVLRDLSLETGELTPGRPVDVALEFTLLSVEPQYLADIGIRGSGQADLATAIYRVDDLRVDFALRDKSESPRSKGTFRGNVSADLDRSVYRIDDVVIEASLIRPPIGRDPLDVRSTWAAAVVDLEQQTLSVTELAGEALGAKATLRVTGANILDQPVLNGSLQISPVPVSSVLEAMSLPQPSGANAGSLGMFQLQTGFSLETATPIVRLNGIDARALDMRLGGDLTLTGRAETGKLTGRVAIPTFSPKKLFELLESTLPEGIDTAPINALSLESGIELDLQKHTMHLSGLKAGLLQTAVEADIRIAGLTADASYSGSLDIPELAPREFLGVFGRLVPEGLRPKALGKLALDTRFEFDPQRDTLTLEKLRARVMGMQFEGALAATSTKTDTAYRGSLAVERFSPRALLERFDVSPPLTADEKALRAVSGSARFTANSSEARFDDIEVLLDETNVVGAAVVRDFSDPAYEFDLAIDAVDVDRYLPPPQATPEGKAETTAGVEVKVPTETLRKLKIGGRASVGSLKLAGLRAGNVSVGFDSRDGLARLDPIKATLYKGTFEGSLSTDVRQAVPTLSIRGSVTDMGIGPFARDFLGEERGPITGTGTFGVSLRGSGETFKQNLETAEGELGFELRDGGLRGFNLGYAVCDAYNVLKRLPRPNRPGKEITRYDEMHGTAVVSGGIARTRELIATLPFLQVTGGGNLTLATQKLDYDFDAKMTGSIGIKRCESMDGLIGKSFPLEIGGTVADPSIRPDFGELLKRKLEDELEDKLKDKLRDILGG